MGGGFQDLKLAMIGLTGLSRDALHVYIGLLVFLGVALLLRRPLRSWLPLAAVVIVALGAELLDLRNDLALHGRLRFGESTHDLVNTAFWPAVLMLLARLGLVRSGE